MTTKSENGAGEEKMSEILGGGPVEEGLGEVQKNTRTQGTRKIAQNNEKTDRKTAKGLWHSGRPESVWAWATGCLALHQKKLGRLAPSWLVLGSAIPFGASSNQKKFNDRRITKKKSSIILLSKRR